MPDWSYQPILRPLLFALPPALARDLSLGFIGRLAYTPLGPAAIDFLGHMRADRRLERTLMGINFPTTVGLGPHLDTGVVATKALARFGVGFIEIGPITIDPCQPSPHVRRLDDQESLWLSERTRVPLASVLHQLNRLQSAPVPLIARLGGGADPSSEQVTLACQTMINQLRPYVQAFSLDTLAQAVDGWTPTQWREHVQAVSHMSLPVLICISSQMPLKDIEPFITIALDVGVAGVIVDGCLATPASGISRGRVTRETTHHHIQAVRETWGDAPIIIGNGGLHEPVDALQFIEAGADLIQVDTGLVFSGPGLPKRINDVLLVTQTGHTPSAGPAPHPTPQYSWFWSLLMGLGMFGGGLLALAIAATRVVLPYDEALIDLTRQQLSQINTRLLAFMAHDRVSLAGSMVSIGLIYLGLAWFGIRQGLHWPRVAVLASASIGFATFFLFLIFGYFDPFHAFVTAILCQFWLLALYAHEVAPAQPPPDPNRVNDRVWRLSLWGQLFFVIHGLALVGAGAVIVVIGATSVFVAEDLAFMQTTAEALHAASHRLVPLIAHDRATFGGLLIANGIAVLMIALWGYRQGYRWLWWMMLGAGVAAYSAALGVHGIVAYTNLWHLAPALGGLVLFILGLVFSYPYLNRTQAPGHVCR